MFENNVLPVSRTSVANSFVLDTGSTLKETAQNAASCGIRGHRVQVIKILFICHGSSKVYIADRGVVGQNAANRGS